jgi:hypothetical protein
MLPFFDVDPVDPAVAARQRKLAALADKWTAEQIAAGVDGPVPDGRRSGSDYNQHVPAMDAPGAAQDEFHTAAAKIMGIGA